MQRRTRRSPAWSHDAGVSIVEYGIIVALFALAVIGGGTLLFQGLRAAYVSSSGDVGTPAAPTQAPSRTTSPTSAAPTSSSAAPTSSSAAPTSSSATPTSSSPTPTSSSPTPTVTHVAAVAPTLTQTVQCNSQANATFDIAGGIGFQDARVTGTPTDNGRATATVNGGRTRISYDPDTSGQSDCGSTVTINYTFSYTENGKSYSDGTGQLKVIVKAPHQAARAPLQTITVPCTNGTQASVDLGPILTGNGWASPTITDTDTSNGNNTATVSGTTVRYVVDGSGQSTDCGKTVTVDYTFSYTEDGVRYTDGTGQVKVVVQPRHVAPIIAKQSQTISCLGSAEAQFALSSLLNADGRSNAAVTIQSVQNGRVNETSVQGTTVSFDPRTGGGTNDCGKTITINYTFSYTENGVSYNDGVGALEVTVRPR